VDLSDERGVVGGTEMRTRDLPKRKEMWWVGVVVVVVVVVRGGCVCGSGDVSDDEVSDDVMYDDEIRSYHDEIDGLRLAFAKVRVSERVSESEGQSRGMPSRGFLVPPMEPTCERIQTPICQLRDNPSP
jgi:hypothetical protein